MVERRSCTSGRRKTKFVIIRIFKYQEKTDVKMDRAAHFHANKVARVKVAKAQEAGRRLWRHVRNQRQSLQGNQRDHK